MKNKHYVVLVTGLGSSIPIIGNIWRRWATKLETSLREALTYGHGPVEIIIVSSDGNGEEKAVREVVEAIRNKNVLSLSICGHSNGFRDGLNFAKRIAPFPVNYFGGIDMTLGEFGAKASSNIQVFDEFHAKLQTADFDDDFDKERHRYFKIHAGHTAAASKPFVRNRIVAMVLKAINNGNRHLMG